MREDTAARAAGVIERGLMLRHRGPDQFGTWIDGTIGVAAARLALLDLKCGSQPMHTPRGTVLVFNGEIYNNTELRAELLVRGWKFQTHSDTEVLLASYETWGENAWKRLNGMFAAAIYEPARKRLTLVRDRLGIKPLFYRTIEDRIEFASEAGAWPEFRSPNASLNLKTVINYLRFAQTTDGPDSLYTGVHVLEPGTMLVFEQGQARTTRWYLPDLLPDTAGESSPHIVRARLRHLLHLSVGRQLVADAEVGVLLSGGLDSTLLCGLARQMTPARIRTYSVGLEGDHEDLEFARRVSNYWGTPHTERIVSTTEYFAAMRELTRLRISPVTLPNEVLIYCISLTARNHVKALLSGEGADELFGGYSNIIGAFQAHTSDTAPNLSDYLNNVCSWFQPEELLGLLNADARRYLEVSGIRHDLMQVEEKEGVNALLHWLVFRHLPHLLARLDGATMAASLEGRVPYTDVDLMNYVLRLPCEVKCNGLGHDKPLLREVYADWMPDFVLTRPKRAFHASLERLLLSSEGVSELQRVANDEAMSQLFDMDRLRPWMNRNTHPAGLFRQWLLLGLNLWLNRNIL